MVRPASRTHQVAAAFRFGGHSIDPVTGKTPTPDVAPGRRSLQCEWTGIVGEVRSGDNDAILLGARGVGGIGALIGSVSQYR